MRSSLMNLILIFSFTPMAVFAASKECETLLTHSYSKVVSGLLRQGILSVDDLKAGASSSIPVSPLANRTPGSRDAGAITFFRKMLEAGITPEAWQTIRSELNAILAERGSGAEVAQAAIADTALIVAPMQLEMPQIAELWAFETWVASDGRVLYIDRQMTNNRVQVRDLNDPSWKFQAQDVSNDAFVGLSEDAMGRVRLNVIAPIQKSWLENLWLREDKFLWKRYAVDSDEVKSRNIFLPPVSSKTFLGQDTKGPIFFQGSRGQVDVLVTADYAAYLGPKIVVTKSSGLERSNVSLVADGRVLIDIGRHGTNFQYVTYNNREIIEVPEAKSLSSQSSVYTPLLLRDGRLAVVSRMKFRGLLGNSIEFSQGQRHVDLDVPSAGGSSLFETRDGRILVAATTKERTGEGIRIFEPLNSDKAIVEVQFDFVNYGSPKLFEFDGRLFLSTVDQFGRLHIFEPLTGPNEIASVLLGVHEHQIVTSAKQVYVTAFINGSVKAYSLFHYQRRGGP